MRTASKEPPMPEQEQRVGATRTTEGYPLGRGYGHDYMRGGEVFGGYGYSDRPEYERRRGEPEPGPESRASS
ncbi:MAG: hypothetical protein MUE41_02070 [Gemmatimonadaceae bacterium]|nr:hypothetical protein [Gemmatimonadaceae bacterium]